MFTNVKTELYNQNLPERIKDAPLEEDVKDRARKIHKIIHEITGRYSIVAYAMEYKTGQGEFPAGVNDASIVIVMNIDMFTDLIISCNFDNDAFKPVTRRDVLKSGIYAFYYGIPIMVVRRASVLIDFINS